LKKEKLILIGGGGHCVSCIDVIEEENKYEIVGILDQKEKLGQKLLGYSFIGTDNDIPRLAKDHYFLITIGQIGNAEKRTVLFEQLKKLNAVLPKIISPKAHLSRHAFIGEGSIVMHLAIVNANASVGQNCIINSRAIVEHDAYIGNNCHISTGAIINGGVKVGENTFFGSGAVSKEYINIPANSFIKANSIVK
jgi:sugar O-acyltransferase (sialic acid O-acetyltransferase NeuD family)